MQKSGMSHMDQISRRSALTTLLGATVAVTGFGCAESPGRPAAPPPAAPPSAPPQGPAVGGAALRQAFTDSDRALYQDCINKTMRAPVGRVWRWRNPRSGNGGSMAPTSPPQFAGGQTCRTFNETITLKDGRSETFSGQACQRADGSWNIVA